VEGIPFGKARKLFSYSAFAAAKAAVSFHSSAFANTPIKVIITISDSKCSTYGSNRLSERIQMPPKAPSAIHVDVLFSIQVPRILPSIPGFPVF
jgi:hypothetical protein